MPMIPNVGFPDGEFFDTGMAEAGPAMEEAVVVNRFISISGGDGAAGVAPTKTYTSIQSTALIESLSPQEVANSGGFYEAGDIKAQFKLQIFGAEDGANGATGGGDGQSAGRYSDLITYRGRKYKVVGHPDRVHFGGIYYWNALLRQSRS